MLWGKLESALRFKKIGVDCVAGVILVLLVLLVLLWHFWSLVGNSVLGWIRGKAGTQGLEISWLREA